MKLGKSKTFKQAYRKSRAFDATCRCHGSCDWCRNGRMHNAARRLRSWFDKLKDYTQ